MDPEFRFTAFLLAGTMIIVFAFQQQLPLNDLILVSAEAFEKPWMFFTHIFLHGSLTHMLSNIFSLALFGSILERLVGWKKLLWIFFLGGIASSFGDIGFYQSSLGASGAVFAVLGALTVIKPRMGVFAFGIPIPMFLAAILWASLDLAGMFYPDNIAHAAHLFGMLAGGLIGLGLRKPEPKKPKPPDVDKDQHKKWEDFWFQRPYPEER